MIMRGKIVRRLGVAAGVVILVLALFCNLLNAQGKAKLIHFDGSEVTRKKVGIFYITTLTEGVATQEDATFKANMMVVKSEGNVHEITCTGDPVFTDTENHITGEKVVALSSPRQAEFVGNVKMVSNPKNNPANNKDNMRNQLNSEPSTTTCDRLSYFYSAKRAVAKGNVMIVQKARTVWADEATYDQKLELVTLRGNVRVKNTGKEELKDLHNAETVTVSLQNDWVDVLAKKGSRVSIDIEVNDEEDQQPTAGEAKPAETKPQSAEGTAKP